MLHMLCAVVNESLSLINAGAHKILGDYVNLLKRMSSVKIP